jgi:hypothetical protein
MVFRSSKQPELRQSQLFCLPRPVIFKSTNFDPLVPTVVLVGISKKNGVSYALPICHKKQRFLSTVNHTVPVCFSTNVVLSTRTNPLWCIILTAQVVLTETFRDVVSSNALICTLPLVMGWTFSCFSHTNSRILLPLALKIPPPGLMKCLLGWTCSFW